MWGGYQRGMLVPVADGMVEGVGLRQDLGGGK